MADIQIIKKTIDLLDEFGPLYYEESISQTRNYLEYVKLAQRAGKADEKTLIQPRIFPAFLEDILEFSKIDYIPEKRNKHKKAPDFTPIDTNLHPFIFETKGSDSTLKSIEKEFRDKSKYYLLADTHAKYAIITNMQDLVVYSKETSSKLEDYCFSFINLYQTFKTEGLFNIKDINIQRFLKFVDKFKKKELTIEKKIESIANAEPYPQLFGIVSEERDSLKLTNSIHLIVNILKDDIKNNRGKEYLLKRLENDTLRKEQIAREIYSIYQSINSGYKVPNSENVTSEDLYNQLGSNNLTVEKSREVYFYRIAYFTMTRLLLIRVWEDAKFIDAEYVTLFNGGFKKWYNAHNKKIGKVIEQAYNIAKDKYEWLFTEQNNYAWYVPTDSVLVDVLYEFAKYNLSIVNRDVLGTVYEEYLDIQDKKNKGQYYTPHQIVEFIWDRLGYTSPRWGDETAFFNFDKDGKRVPKLIFDPATGSGSFPVEAIYRLRNYFSLNRSLQTKVNLEDAKNAIVKGIHGCEISAFSYYLTEVNILIQLTPIIKKLIELNEIEKELSGKFTLHVIHQDSLSLHNKSQEFIEKEVTEDYIEDKDHDILKLEGEKLRIFKFIKENKNFDYAVANPPYIGEDGHKGLFRSTLEKYPHWKNYYQGKMDYLYFFIILALQKLKEGGKLGFITTSYWLTADGASKLRKYILDNAKIIEIIYFNEIKLFEHAKGQHNIVFTLQKSTKPEENEKAEYKIKVVQVKKECIGKNLNEKLTNLINHLKNHIEEDYYVDDYIDVYYSAVKQGELTEKAWYIFHSEKTKLILDKIKQYGKPLIECCDVNQGLISGCHKVSSGGIKLLNRDTINSYGIKIGDGIFILTNNEINTLNIDTNEKTILRPFFKNSDIFRYYINAMYSEEYVIYTTKDTYIEDYPIIRNHLKKYEHILRKRLDTYNEKYPWYKLHREREKDIFEGPKIICPYRSKINVFGYTDKPFYGSTDMYFITEKRNRKNELKMVDYEMFNLFYILGILNSSLFRIWCYYKTKPKGNTRELFYTPLIEMPIRPIDFENDKEKEQYDIIINEVEKIMKLKEEINNYNKYFDVNIVQIEKDTAIPDIILENVIRDLNQGDIRNLWTSGVVRPIEPFDDFVLKKVGDIGFNLEKENTEFELTLILTGAGNKNNIKIDGNKEALKCLKQLLEKDYIDCSWKDIENNLLLPSNMEILTEKMNTIISNIENFIKEISQSQDTINNIVYELYGVKKQDAEEILNELS